MFGCEVNITINTSQLSNEIDVLQKKLDDLTPFWHGAEPLIKGLFRTVFAGEGQTPMTPAWMALTPKYKAYKARVRPGQKKGRFNDRLFHSTVSNPLIKIDNTSLTLISTVPHAYYFEMRRPLFGYVAIIAPAALQPELLAYLRKR